MDVANSSSWYAFTEHIEGKVQGGDEEGILISCRNEDNCSTAHWLIVYKLQ